MIGLIADIGATNARFALADAQGIYEERVLQCDDHPTISDAARHYLESVNSSEKPSVGAFAIAGPVDGDWFEVTNNHWKFSVKDTRQALDLDTLHLFNDFEAVAMAVPHIEEKYLHKIGGGTAKQGAPIAVLGPGTGLGVCCLSWTGTHYKPMPAEGGHITMPAKTQREFDLFRTLRYKYSHVSAERVCSGKGLENLYNAIRILDGQDSLPDRTPAEISRAAIAQECAVCEEALDKMCKFLGSIAGNLVLSVGAFGGVYIAGGIPAKLGDYFFESHFYEELVSKGRFRDYLSKTPVYLIDHPYTALIGLQADLFAGQ